MNYLKIIYLDRREYKVNESTCTSKQDGQSNVQLMNTQ